MFYATTIKSVGGGGVVDAQGRRLTFLGYLPVKAGDTVYTDGRYIFGNAPPKGSPAVFDTSSGIPVLGDEYSLSTSDPKEELRGYVNKSGKYKRFRIAGDEWTTNAKKTYAHDGSIDGVDDANVIDAEIALDENGAEDGVYTVEKIVKERGEADDDNFYIVYSTDNTKIESASTLRKQLAKTYTNNRIDSSPMQISWSNADYSRCDDEVRKECALIIRNDDTEKQTVNLSELLKDFETSVRADIDFIRISNHAVEDHTKSRAILHNFKMNADGTWVALIEIEIFAERGFYAIKTELEEKRNIRNAQKAINRRCSPEEIYSETLDVARQLGIQEISRDFVEWLQEDNYRITEIFGWLDTKTYSIKDESDSLYYCTSVYNISLLKIVSDGTVAEIIFTIRRHTPLYMIEVVYEYVDNFVEPSSSTSNVFPANDQSYMPKTRGQFEIDVMQPIMWDQIELTIAHGGYDGDDGYYLINNYTYDSRNLENAPDYDNPVEEIADDFSFPVQDEYTATIESWQDETPAQDETFKPVYWKLGGIYDKDSKRVVDGTDESFSGDEETAHQWNMSLATLKSGDYLFGIRDDQDRDIDGKLFRINGSDGKVAETLAEHGFKNFRLRELKKISKAKK